MNENENKNIRFARLREELKLSMAKMGKPIFLSPSSVNEIEKERREVTDRTIEAICREYNVNETWLRTGEGEMFEEKTPSKEFGVLMGALLRSDSKHKELKQKLMIELLKLDDSQWDTVLNIAQSLVGELDDKKKETSE